MNTTRRVYRQGDLGRLLAPRTIAVVGASPNRANFAGRTLDNLAAFKGTIRLVNAKYERIGDERCYPSLAALPESPDCVVIAIAKDSVAAVIDDAIAVGAGGAIVFASGYAETGKAEHVALQRQLTEKVAGTSLRVIGPNCIGLVNVGLGVAATFMFVPEFAAPTPKSIGLVSQSGALGFALGQGAMRGVSFSHVLTAGNSADVDVADEVAYLAEDPGCAAIACVFEGMPDPTRLFEAADLAWAANKPLIIFKLAVGEQGAAAALSHTGSLAGSRAAYAAAFRRHGIIEVDSFEALTETASFFAKAPPPKAEGVAVIATSGGAAILAADVAEKYGVSLPQPSAAVTAILSAEIPEFGSARNPCDVTAQVLSNPESLARCAGSLLGDPAFGILLYPTVYANDTVAARQPVFDRLAAEAGKLIGVVWLSQWYEGPGAALAEQHPNLVLFHSMDRAFATLAAWHRQARLRRVRADGVAAPVAVDPALRSDCAAKLAEAVRLAPPLATDVVLTEREAKAVLAGYGVPVVADRLARSRDEAVAAAAALGHPVVMKIESPDIAHKTEAGGVMLALADDDAVAAAYDRILMNAASHDPTARLTGVLVQPMAPAGVEMLIGARVDPQFGPLIVVGMGGVLVELLHDSALALAPVAVDEARSMIDSLRAARLLDGFRGARPVDRGALAELVARVSTFVADHRDTVVELDLNPVICHPDGIVAVDALIRLAPAAAGAA